MRISLTKMAIASVAAGLITLSASGQEGHPAKGSWIGEWEGNTINGESLLMIMNWDGKNITGIINPGTDNIEISRASLNPDNWSIHIEAGSYVLDGDFARLELPNRSISGTWRNGNSSGDFEIVRQ
jgi:hypothetical protein